VADHAACEQAATSTPSGLSCRRPGGCMRNDTLPIFL
jgi:hypothetical protein